MSSETHTRLIQTQTHWRTCHINKHSSSRCACCLSTTPRTERVSVQLSVWSLLLVNVFVFSLLFFVCPTLQAESHCVCGEADGQVPPVLKNIYSLYTHSLKAPPPSLGFPASSHLRPRPLVPPGELSLSVHFFKSKNDDWCHSESLHFWLFGFIL